MVQNHILQILALVAMEPPQSFEAVRQNKINVLEQLRHYSPDEVAKNFVRGQYGPSLDGSLPGYRQDQNVSDDSNMETYVAGKVFIDNERWKDVPFYVRTGKSFSLPLQIDITASGTRYSKEFGAFLKETYGDIPSDLPYA